MRYIVVGPTIVNDIYIGGQKTRERQLGGAVFALQGALLWDESVLYVSNVGSDFAEYYGSWVQENAVDLSGLYESLPHTQYTALHYDENELHDESSIYGLQEEKLVERLDKISADQLVSHIQDDTRAVYLEISEQDDFWNEYDKVKSTGVLVMWEIRTSSVQDAQRAKKTLELLRKVDIYSLNMHEAKMLFRLENEAEVVEKLKELGVPCYLRMGARGSAMVCGDCYRFAPSMKIGDVVDTTGCGNASTAAAMVGFAEKRGPAAITKMGNIAAWYNLQQYGPYPSIAQVRKSAVEMLNEQVD